MPISNVDVRCSHMTEQERLHLIKHYQRELLAGSVIIIIFLILTIILSYFCYHPRNQSDFHVSLGMVVLMLAGLFAVFCYCLLFGIRVRRDLEENIVITGQANILRKYVGQTKGGNVNYFVLDELCPKKKIQVSAPTYAGMNIGDRIEVIYFPHSKVLFCVRKI